MNQHRFAFLEIRGSFLIKPTVNFDKAASILSECLNIQLEFDDSGYYEEVPAYTCNVLGLNIEFFGIPEGQEGYYNLAVNNRFFFR